MLFKEVMMPNLVQTIHCTWEPGTFDRVHLHRSGDESDAQIGIELLREMGGRPAIEGLYLKGQFDLECTPKVQKKLKDIPFSR
jgi:hypothetical protein